MNTVIKRPCDTPIVWYFLVKPTNQRRINKKAKEMAELAMISIVSQTSDN